METSLQRVQRRIPRIHVWPGLHFLNSRVTSLEWVAWAPLKWSVCHSTSLTLRLHQIRQLSLIFRDVADTSFPVLGRAWRASKPRQFFGFYVINALDTLMPAVRVSHDDALRSL